MYAQDQPSQRSSTHLVSPVLFDFSVHIHIPLLSCLRNAVALEEYSIHCTFRNRGGTMDFALYISLSQWEVEMM